MMPNVNQDELVKKAYFDTSKLMTKASLKVLRREFGFSPEMISSFVAAVEKELKK